MQYQENGKQFRFLPARDGVGIPCIMMITRLNFPFFLARNDLQTNKLIHNSDKTKTLMARWRFPSLSLHGMQGAFSEPGSKTVIPRKVIGKFSIRIVPNQTPEIVEKCVVDYLNKKWAERGSKNKMEVSMGHGGRCWMSDPDQPNYMAGRKATQMVYGVEPDLTREGKKAEKLNSL